MSWKAIVLLVTAPSWFPVVLAVLVIPLSVVLAALVSLLEEKPRRLTPAEGASAEAIEGERSSEK